MPRCCRAAGVEELLEQHARVKAGGQPGSGGSRDTGEHTIAMRRVEECLPGDRRRRRAPVETPLVASRNGEKTLGLSRRRRPRPAPGSRYEGSHPERQERARRSAEGESLLADIGPLFSACA